MKLKDIIILFEKLEKEGIKLTEEQIKKLANYSTEDVQRLIKTKSLKQLLAEMYVIDRSEGLSKTVALNEIETMKDANLDLLDTLFNTLFERKLDILTKTNLSEFVLAVLRTKNPDTVKAVFPEILHKVPFFEQGENLVEVMKLYSICDDVNILLDITSVVGNPAIRDDKKLGVATILSGVKDSEISKIAKKTAFMIGNSDAVEAIITPIARAKGIEQAQLARDVVAKTIANNKRGNNYEKEVALMPLLITICTTTEEDFLKIKKDYARPVYPGNIAAAIALADIRQLDNFEYVQNLIGLLCSDERCIKLEDLYSVNPDGALQSLKTLNEDFKDAEYSGKHVYVKLPNNKTDNN